MQSFKDFADRLKARLAQEHPLSEEQRREYDRKCQENLLRQRGCKPECEICHGEAFIRDAEDHLIPCPNSDSRQRVDTSRCGLVGEELKLTFDQVEPKPNDIFPALKAVTEAVGRGWGLVYLWGGTGLGKSLLLKTAVAVSLQAGQPAAYSKTADIMDNLRSAYRENSGEPIERLMDHWAGLPLLAIDELDRVNDTGFALERFPMLIDRRYNDADRHCSVTLMASNRSPNFLDEHLRDRIYDMRFRVVQLTGISRRSGIRW